jgi:UDPglucose 6-dehydrogenase
MSGQPTIAFAGMTHLGVCSAVGAASKEFPTIGFAPEDSLISALNDGRFPIVEPDLEALARTHRPNLSFSADPTRLAHADVIYVAPDVPTDDAGSSNLAPLESLLEVVFAHSRPDAAVVVLSQVTPGFTRAHQVPGRTLHYQVETLIFGRAIERATKPERFIVGCADPSVPLPGPYAVFLQAFGCPILPMGFESAELSKIAINCCLVASIGVANTLAELCERIGADWSEVVPALKLDRRIGQYSYLAPGLGLAGGNLERDLATVRRMADQFGTDSGIVQAWIANSRYRKDWVLRALHSEVLGTIDHPQLAVLGLAYKENTHSIKNSPSIALLAYLAPFDVSVYDPVVPASAAPHPVRAATNALDACRGVDAVLIMTPWPEFGDLAPAAIAKSMRGNAVIDPYRVLDGEKVRAAGLRYMTLGVAATGR